MKNFKNNIKNVIMAVFALVTISAFVPNTTAFAKTMAVIGDSYSTFDSEGTGSDRYYYPMNSTVKGNDVTLEEQSWRNVLAKKLGAELTYVDAISGSELTARSAQDDRAMVNRIRNSRENLADVVILMGGLNDYWQNRAIGSTSANAATIENAGEYAPALRLSLETLKRKNPSAKIVYALVCYDAEIAEYKAAAQTICNDLGITFVPVSGMTCVSWHPTIAGMQTIANQMYAAI